MPTVLSRWLPYARLFRVPNLFTAIADPLAGWFVIGGGADLSHLWLLLGASACLYAAGMVFNDCFDYDIDSTERPERPLPSGEIMLSTAWTLGTVLMVTGILLAALVGPASLVMALVLAGFIFFYNAWAKRFFPLGPLTMGACRFANFYLGMRCAPLAMLGLPALVGMYVVTLSVLARQEVAKPALRFVVKRMILGIIVLDATLVLLTGNWVGAAIILSLLIPAVTLARSFAMT